MKNNLLPIAKSGILYVACATFVSVIFYIIDFELLSFLSFLLAIFFIYVFRNPEREVMHFEELSVLSPADGVVVSIDELDETSGYRYKVQIDGSYSNPALLRTPFSSLVTDVTLTRGSKLSNRVDLASKLNENLSITFEDNSSNSVKVSHMVKQTFFDIESDIIKKQKLYQGTRYATMVNGITTIYLPQNFRLNIKEGNELKASESLIGYFS